MSNIILESTLTCPECGFVRTGTMPTDACLGAVPDDVPRTPGVADS